MTDMRIRQLHMKDAAFMYEWMHDENVVGKLISNFASKTLEDCIDFILNSVSDSNIHLAIASLFQNSIRILANLYLLLCDSH